MMIFIFFILGTKECKIEVVCSANSWKTSRGGARELHEKHKLSDKDKK